MNKKVGLSLIILGCVGLIGLTFYLDTIVHNEYMKHFTKIPAGVGIGLAFGCIKMLIGIKDKDEK